MGLPKTPDARLYCRVAKQRLADARLLRDNDRTTGAVYLAGYAVECVLKALVLSRLTGRARRAMVDSFRGSRGHDFEWLRRTYSVNGGEKLPKDIAGAFTKVNTWNTHLRYQAAAIARADAIGFLNSAEAILAWAERRL